MKFIHAFIYSEVRFCVRCLLIVESSRPSE